MIVSDGLTFISDAPAELDWFISFLDPENFCRQGPHVAVAWGPDVDAAAEAVGAHRTTVGNTYRILLAAARREKINILVDHRAADRPESVK